DFHVTGVQTCALPISRGPPRQRPPGRSFPFRPRWSFPRWASGTPTPPPFSPISRRIGGGTRIIAGTSRRGAHRQTTGQRKNPREVGRASGRGGEADTV